MSTGKESAAGAGVASILGPRLDLVSLSPAAIDALLQGELRRASDLLGVRATPVWVEASTRVLRYRQRQLRLDPALQPWLVRALVQRAAPGGQQREVIGHAGFHGAPDARGAVELGYAILPDYRRQGFAEEAVRALCDWAQREHGVSHFVASVAPHNAPSLGLVRKLGFRQTGTQWDEEDGEELVLELHRQAPAT